MIWFVYMLRCRDNSIYTGITNNLYKRIGAHMSGNGSKYLRGRLPVELIYKEDFSNRSKKTKEKRKRIINKVCKANFKEKICLNQNIFL